MTKIDEKFHKDKQWKETVHANSNGDRIVASIKPALRVESVDLLRGIVMIIMALDHVRDFFHFDAFLYSPEDIVKTSGGLFVTRWITHLCAPTFIFLAGVSTYFIAQRKSQMETSFFLLTRGIWLVALQLTIIRFAWNFDPLFHYNSNTIISTIGFCMIILAGLLYLRLSAIFIIGLGMVLGHNLLDGISFEQGSATDVMWSFLHVSKSFFLGSGYTITIVYPIIPWVGVMALGYCFGGIYNPDLSSKRRKSILLQIGLISLIVFLTFRTSNIYGDPVPWSKYAETSHTFMSFFNLQKYPPSMLYLTSTLVISMLLLAAMEGKNLTRWRSVMLFGNVALFYYVVHIFLIHILAVLAAVLTGHPWHSMVFLQSPTTGSPWLIGSYGFNLGVVYLVWLAVVIMLYPLCRYWYSFKIRNKKKWWVSYV